MRVHKLNEMYEKLLEFIPTGDDLSKEYLKSKRVFFFIYTINYIKALQHLLSLILYSLSNFFIYIFFLTHCVDIVMNPFNVCQINEMYRFKQ